MEFYHIKSLATDGACRSNDDDALSQLFQRKYPKRSESP